MTINVQDSRMERVVDPNAQRQVIAETFEFTEGPIWHPVEKHLTFSDIPASRLYRYADGEVSVYREPSNLANGNTYDRQGRMLSCEHGTSRVAREENGELAVIASHYEGKELNSPNDIVVRCDGTMFFTDPTYGRQGEYGVERDLELDFRGVYQIASDGALTLLADDFNQPNGLCLSLDESELFVADTENNHVRRFRLISRVLEGGDVFCKSPEPDGLKIDTAGNLYAGGPDGVYVYDGGDAGFLGVIETPDFCANFTWGDDDFRSMYLTACNGLYRVRVNIPGRPLF